MSLKLCGRGTQPKHQQKKTEHLQHSAGIGLTGAKANGVRGDYATAILCY
jgi:hypothetical protein